MQKKLLVAAIMAALTLSTASVFAAAPTFSGDGNIEYNKDTGVQANITNRIRLNADVNLIDDMYAHTRLAMNNYISNKDNNTGAQSPAFDQAYIGGKIDTFDVKAGLQPIFLGKGLLADVNKGGIGVGTQLDGIKLNGFYGKDGGNNLTTVDMGTSFNGINMGTSYIKLGDNHAWGINADTKIMDNTVLNVEYIKNNASTDAKGYLAELKVGNAIKKGDMDYAISYRNIEANALNGFASYSTDSPNNAASNYADSKGLKLRASYKVTNDATLNLYHDMAKTSSTDVDKKRTDVEFAVKF